MTRLEFDKIAAATKQSATNMEDMILSARKLAALGEFIQTGEKGADWEELFPTPKAAPAPKPSSGGGGTSSPAPAPAPAPAPRPQASPSKPTVATAALASSVARAQADVAKTGPTGQDPNAAARLQAAKMVQASLTKTGNVSTAYMYRSGGGMIIPKRMAVGGFVGGYSPPPLQMNMGGKVKGYAAGGFSMGSDIIPAMLTPGEFVVRKRAVQNFGMENLEKINSGTYNDGSVYNYNLAINVKSNSDPNRIARTVIAQIKQVENQRIRSNKI